MSSSAIANIPNEITMRVNEYTMLSLYSLRVQRPTLCLSSLNDWRYGSLMADAWWRISEVIHIVIILQHNIWYISNTTAKAERHWHEKATYYEIGTAKADGKRQRNILYTNMCDSPHRQMHVRIIKMKSIMKRIYDYDNSTMSWKLMWEDDYS